MKALRIIFTLVGIVLLLITFFTFNNTQKFLDKARLTQGVVTELLPRESRDSDSKKVSTTYAPVVEFITDAGETITYISSSSSNPPSYDTGESISIYYLPDSPQRAKIDGFMDLWFGTVILAGFGSLFFLIGFGSSLFVRMRKNKDAALLANGMAIATNYQNVELNRSLKVNGRYPFKIVTHWQNPDTGQLHIFKSKNIWFDPSDYIEQDKITVYVEPNNYKKYYLDTSFLPTVA